MAKQTKKTTTDLETIRAAVAFIDARAGMPMPHLVDDLKDHFKATVTARGGTATVRIAGLSVTASAGGVAMAITNWCNKARRTLLKGEVA